MVKFAAIKTMKNKNMRPIETADFEDAALNDEIESLEIVQNSKGESRVFVNRKPLPAEQFYLTVRRNPTEPRVYREQGRMIDSLRKAFKGKIIQTFSDDDTLAETQAKPSKRKPK